MDRIDRDLTQWIFYGVVCSLIGFGAGIFVRYSGERHVTADIVEPSPLLARVEALEKRADDALKTRCFNFTTDRMDLAIFPVEKLGKVKVPAPEKKEGN